MSCPSLVVMKTFYLLAIHVIHQPLIHFRFSQLLYYIINFLLHTMSLKLVNFTSLSLKCSKRDFVSQCETERM